METAITSEFLSFAFFGLPVLTAHKASQSLLPVNSTRKIRTLYAWHLFDFLIHTYYGGSFVYFSLFASAPATRTSTTPTLWGDTSRAYGAKYSSAPAAMLWKVYAKADSRWAVADVGVLTMEIAFLVLGGPISLWISEMVRKGDTRAWFWIVVLSVAEIYGQWMGFGMEWFSGCRNLNTSVAVYKWGYLFGMNSLWVVFPLWAAYESYRVLNSAVPKAGPPPLRGILEGRYPDDDKVEARRRAETPRYQTLVS